MSKDVFVFAEQRDGVVQKVSLELLGKGAQLADELGQRVVAVLLGHQTRDMADMLVAFGASKVICVDDPLLAEYMTEPYAKALTNVIRREDPEIVLCGATAIGRDLAPRVSARVKTGLTADCTSLEIDGESGNLLMTRPAFGGNIMATIVCANTRPQMATVRPGVMKSLDKTDTRTGDIVPFPVAFSKSDRNVEILEVVRQTTKTVDITEAKALVSGGRGLGGPEGFAALRALADALGGEVSSSRAGVDAQWIDRSRQVGQTGKTVRPSLYLACGISGAIQHVAGMQESELIIAVNKNPTAPIFDYADLGVVGDLHEIVPRLTEAVIRYKTRQPGEGR